MKITFEQLPLHFKKKLLPIYLINSDETFLLQESTRMLRETAQNQGFQERKVFHVDSGFSCEDFLAETTQQSLFSEKMLLELRIEATKFNETLKDTLITYIEHLPQDKILFIITDKLETKQQNTKWYKQIEKQGAVITLWPLQGIKLQQWLQQRCQHIGLNIDMPGIQLIKELTEGNLGAAAQAIEKLFLCYGSQKISHDAVASTISNSSYFDVFALMDNALNGNIKQTLIILQNLQNSGIEPVIILWALLRELRNLIAIQILIQQGKSMEEALLLSKVWESKKSITKTALLRLPLIRLYSYIQQAAIIDTMIKGISSGNVWSALSNILLHFCNKS